MDRREAGRRGGRATFARHGRAHMARIGALGFAALARKLGYAGGGRRGALARLIRDGELPPLPDLDAAAAAALARECGLDAEEAPWASGN